MSFSSDLMTILAAGFVIITALFASIYHKKLSQAQKEYEDAKDVVSGITLTFKKRQEKQTEKIDALAYTAEEMRSKGEKLANQVRRHEDRLARLVRNVEGSLLISKKTAEHTAAIHEKMDKTVVTQQDLQKQLTALDERYRGMLPETEGAKAQPLERRMALARLTDTELQVLQILTTEGAKTAPEIESKIGRTREHTARLMKKLFEEGYVERDTHKIPFVYRVVKKLKEKAEIEKT